MNLAGLFDDGEDAVEFAAGETIFESGSEADALYVVLDGEILLRTLEGREYRVGSGEIFGEMALIDASPRSATAVAVAASRLAVVNKRRFLFMVSQTPKFSLAVMRTLVERLRRKEDEANVVI